VAALRRRLLAWWDAGHRALPWRLPRGAADPYRIWLAEVMLQQTRVETAGPYWLRFVERWPTIESLAAEDDAEVLAAWSGLGYYARCRNLLAAAREALSRHGGLPRTLPELRALPGLGPYTAGAVASLAFGVPAAAVDGNAARVLCRVLAIPGDPREPRVKRAIDAAAAALVDPARPGDWNQAVMELGATVCVPRRPRCARCPLEAACAARRQGRETELAARTPRRAPVTSVVALARVERGGRLLLVRAPPRGLLGGLWGLPALEVPAGEDPAGALRRSAPSRLGLRLAVGDEIAVVTRLLTHRRLEMHVVACRLLGRPPRERGRWAFTSEEEAARLPASTAMRRAIEASGGFVRAGTRAHGRRKSPRSSGGP
jgi:A/G-specific adenine glycosylase